MEAIATSDTLKTLLGILLGTGGLFGLLVYFFRRYIERRLDKAEKDSKKRRENRVRRMQVEDEVNHCHGQMLFWLYRFVVTGERNGELDNAYERLQEAEQKKKDLDRSILADVGVGSD